MLACAGIATDYRCVQRVCGILGIPSSLELATESNMECRLFMRRNYKVRHLLHHTSTCMLPAECDICATDNCAALEHISEFIFSSGADCTPFSTLNQKTRLDSYSPFQHGGIAALQPDNVNSPFFTIFLSHLGNSSLIISTL